MEENVVENKNVQGESPSKNMVNYHKPRRFWKKYGEKKDYSPGMTVKPKKTSINFISGAVLSVIVFLAGLMLLQSDLIRQVTTPLVFQLSFFLFFIIIIMQVLGLIASFNDNVNALSKFDSQSKYLVLSSLIVALFCLINVITNVEFLWIPFILGLLQLTVSNSRGGFQKLIGLNGS